MPRLWTQTVEAHRQEVREAILAATGSLIHQRGLLALTMSDIATTAGVGRATLYKYFSDVEEVLDAWHHKQVTAHLAELTGLRDQSGSPADRLRSLLKAYGRIAQQRRHAADQHLTAALHHDSQLAGAQRRLHGLVTGLISEAAEAGVVRSDVPAAELTDYCLHALAAAGQTDAGLERLLSIVWSGLTGPPVG